MNFASGGTEKAPSFKSIKEDSKLETELDKRQEEWEKVKSTEVEGNEGLPIDRRPLWMKLQEQKDKKQAEWDEKHDPKAMVQGLEEEEAEFLNKVADYQSRIKNNQRQEELREMREFREASMQAPHVDPDAQVRDNLFQSVAAQAKKKSGKSQASLFAGLVKTKRKRSLDDDPSGKSSRRSLESADREGSSSARTTTTHGSQEQVSSTAKAEEREPLPSALAASSGAKQAASGAPVTSPSNDKPQGLAGLQAYSDDDSDDDSE
ncbi:PSME3-interacting protein-like [Sycon ciliatum]|uniref:PSME3-interacting protein-like n=1 Tax=Sycon ciliatum TaxID=27933 RepID=UPI0031F60AE7